MENTTVHLPELYLKLIDTILDTNDYPCMSEFIRMAIRKMLLKDKILLMSPIVKENYQQTQKREEIQRLTVQKADDQFISLQKKQLIQKNSINKRKARKTIE
jgi:Arc/MetJ-type ribon-helix-helix transcriptional regulator